VRAGQADPRREHRRRRRAHHRAQRLPDLARRQARAGHRRLSGEQRFFLGFAQIWRRLYRDAELQNRLVTDTHSPSEYRVATIRNIDAWYEAFKPKAGEKLFLAPEQRVRIW